MELITKIRVKTTCHEAFLAFVNPERIGNFWFGKSSSRWEEGKVVMLTYPEFKEIEVPIQIKKIVPDETIAFMWGEGKEEREVRITFQQKGEEVIITTAETPWEESEVQDLLQNKEGWTFMLTCLKAYLENGINTLRLGLFVD